MTQEERNEQVINMMSVLSEPMRIRILLEIASMKELRGKDILERFSVTQPTMSHHMNILVSSGLVDLRKEGRCIWYSINKANMASIKDIVVKIADGRGVSSYIASEPSPRKAVATVKKAPVKKEDTIKPKSLKKNSSVPKPKQIIEVPDIEELKKNKKKKKDKSKQKEKAKDDKKKNKDKKKKK